MAYIYKHLYTTQSDPTAVIKKEQTFSLDLIKKENLFYP